MNRRPIGVTIVGWLLVLTGVAAFAYHVHEVGPRHALQGGNVWIVVTETVVLVCGAFILRGQNWARWLAAVWIGAHVVFSFWGSMGKVAVHVLIFLLFVFFLFRPEANAYFRPRSTPDS